jgi:hypothetical protein
MKLSIKKHNQEYIRELANSLGTTESEAINYLLLKIKSEGFASNAPVPVQASIGFEVPKIAPIQDLRTPSEIADDFYLSQQTDPLIDRLLNAGLEGF